MGIFGPNCVVILYSQVKLQVSKYVQLESATRPVFAEPVTIIAKTCSKTLLKFIHYQTYGSTV